MASKVDITTVRGAYKALTGKDFDGNGVNALGQFDRAFRQSTDNELKEKIQKKLDF